VPRDGIAVARALAQKEKTVTFYTLGDDIAAAMSSGFKPPILGGRPDLRRNAWERLDKVLTEADPCADR